MSFEVIIQEIRKEIEEKFRKMKSEVNDKIVLENYIMNSMCSEPGIAPAKCARELKARCDFDIDGFDVIKILKSRGVMLGNPEERVKIFNWADKTALLIEKAMHGDKESMAKYESINFSDISSDSSGKPNRQLHRILLLMLFNKIPELYNSDAMNTIMNNFGSTYCKNILLTIIKITKRTYGMSAAVKEEEQTDNITEKYNNLLEEYERTNQMLFDLQEEFNDRIIETKQQELTEFFSLLNSEKYGYIIDELFMLRKGFNTLRKNNYEFPPEINNIGVIFNKFMQLIKDSGISPMIKPETVMEVTPNDIENYQYEGTPFSDSNEVKKVLTVSPGWSWKDKDIVISRPKVIEITD